MADPTARLQATKKAATLLVLFIPSRDRFDSEIDQDFWVDEVLQFVGRLFGGGTAFPQGRGVWRDDARGGLLLFDNPVVIQCYTREEQVEQHGLELRAFLVRLGTETGRGSWSGDRPRLPRNRL